MERSVLQYTVNVLQPEVAGFAFSSSSPPPSSVPFGLKGTRPLQAQKIEIATMIRGGEGNRPVAVLPPSQEKPSPWPNVTLGRDQFIG
jgi:hypothetical protein